MLHASNLTISLKEIENSMNAIFAKPASFETNFYFWCFFSYGKARGLFSGALR
jgi:hypothetical protein